MSDRPLNAKQLGQELGELRRTSMAFQLHETIMRHSLQVAKRHAFALQYGARPASPGEAPQTESEFIALKSRAEGMVEGVQKVLEELDELEKMLLDGKLPPFVKNQKR